MGEGAIFPALSQMGAYAAPASSIATAAVDFGTTTSSKDSQLGQQIPVSKSSLSFSSTPIRIDGSSKNVQQARLGHNQGSKEAGGGASYHYLRVIRSTSAINFQASDFAPFFSPCLDRGSG